MRQFQLTTINYIVTLKPPVENLKPLLYITIRFPISRHSVATYATLHSFSVSFDTEITNTMLGWKITKEALVTCHGWSSPIDTLTWQCTHCGLLSAYWAKLRFGVNVIKVKPQVLHLSPPLNNQPHNYMIWWRICSACLDYQFLIPPGEVHWPHSLGNSWLETSSHACSPHNQGCSSTIG